MHPYLPHTSEDITKMLAMIGVSSIDDLFEDIPENIRLGRELNLDESLSEIEIEAKLRQLASMNDTVKDNISFIGGGSYNHYIPAIIKHLAMRQEFSTAYTPYQPELSQGTLQVIFEYQSMICELTGMDVSNASLYDGGTSMAEAVFMANHVNKKNDVLVSKSVNPQYREIVKTYARFKGLNYIEIDIKDGVTDTTDLESKISSDSSCVIIQTPNYNGLVEDVAAVRISMDAVKNKAQFIVSVNPISLALFEAPANYGADIVVGEGQSLGNSVQFGGPYLGFIASTKENMRRMPGRIVGQTTDLDGKRAFVLTLQAREQHIRREKAMSNITSNQGLNALMATIYLATMGKTGLLEVAKQSMYKAHYLADSLDSINGIALTYKQPFFNEFMITTDEDANEIYNQLTSKGIFAGVIIDEHHILMAVTEVHTKEHLDKCIHEMEVIA
jgi:glycine dehydrogenase subunit 1